MPRFEVELADGVVASEKVEMKEMDFKVNENDQCVVFRPGNTVNSRR